MVTIDSIVTFSFGSIVGFIVSELIKDRLARTRGIEAIRIVEFNKAAAEFRAAFVDIIHVLRNANQMKTGDECFHTMKQFRSRDVNHTDEKAKIIFEPFIEKNDLPGFNAAWDDYYDWQKHIKNKDNNVVPDFLGHIYALLEYAKPKI